MAEIVTTPLHGVITAQGRFRPTYGVVTLDEPHGTFKYAVICDETVGRIALLNLSPDGSLPVRQRVVVNKARESGGDALIALEVASA